MADEQEDTLLASMKEAIQKEKGEVEKPVDEEKDEGADETVEEDNSSDDKDKDTEEVAETEDEDSSEDAEPTRGQTRHQKLANQLKEERAEREKERKEREQLIAERATYAAKLEHYEQQQKQGQSQAERRAEEDRLSLLSPEERRAYDADMRSRQLEHRFNQMEMQRQDDLERAEFRAKAASDPLVEKYKDRVEQMRQEDLKRGFTASRDSYLNFIVGEALRKDAAKKLSSKKEAAGKRIDSVTSKSAKARGDVSGTKKGKGDSLEELEARLSGVVF